MTFDEGADQHHLIEWLEDSVSFLPTFLEEPCAVADEICGYEWRKVGIEIRGQDGNEEIEESELQRKVVVRKKANGKGGGASSSNGGGKDARWAEQLLNPCAVAIEAANFSRVQHLFYVLDELASLSGDANHRVAFHGLRALSFRLFSSAAGASALRRPPSAAAATAVPCFATTEPKLFRSALIKFHEVSPWFTLPNALANAAILQTLTLDRAQARPLHVVDLGVSHGVQWPTLLEALTRRPGGGPQPPLVRLTVAGDSAPPGPFSRAPPGYDFSSHLLRYAKSIDLNLRIDRAGSLAGRDLALGAGETLVVCAQFRLGHAGHDDRTAILRSVRELNPDLVILSDLDGADSAVAGGGSPGGFARGAEMLWRFLDSTSAAFKGRDCGERRVVEGEGARKAKKISAITPLITNK
ncbi:nodulation-signaling pathway 1 protein [Ananas comosus]|uniref:Nodulation-signaling pathway 1 protein n=1 Tax=Ananas comosus TaxID=4615 RepID=A0A6P5GFJ2_ANACO|nr:nodulation-signaling pathway 1 protein [Ananas comosus]